MVMEPDVVVNDIDDGEEVIDNGCNSAWRRGIENLRRLVSRRRLSRRLLVVSIRHDYVSRLRRAFLALKTRGARALSMAVQRCEDARSWRRSRLLAMLYGLWVAYVQEEKQQLDQSLTTGAALFRRKSLRKYFLRLRLTRRINERVRRKVALGETYSAFLRLYEGLSLLKTRTVARQHRRQHLEEKLELSGPIHRRWRLAAVLQTWLLKRRSSALRSKANAVAVRATRQRSFTLALSSWQSFTADQSHRRNRYAYAAHEQQSRQLVVAVSRWQRVIQQSKVQSRAMGVAVQHDGFLGTYRRCVKVLVKLVTLMKRSLLRRRKVAVSDKAHKRHLVQQGWHQVRAYRTVQRIHAAMVLKADFHRDMRKLSIHFQQLQHHHASQLDSKHALLKGVLIWKMSRLLTGIRRWHHWVLRKVHRRRMRLAAQAGHGAEVATRACRVLLTAAAAVGGRNADDRRRKLVVMTLKQWKRFTLRGQLEREKVHQRAFLSTALEQTRALGRGVVTPGRMDDAAAGRSAAAGSGAVSGTTTSDLGGLCLPVPDLLKAKPRPLTPFLVFQSSGSGSGGVGSSLTCALGSADNIHLANTAATPVRSPSSSSIIAGAVRVAASSSPPPPPASSSSASSSSSTAAGAGAVAVAGAASVSPWSSPVSVASIGSARFLSQGDRRHSCSGGGGGGGGGSGSGSSGLGLARALPRKPSLLGCSLFDGLTTATTTAAAGSTGAGSTTAAVQS